ncbi:hypothetical protein LXA43DRAFT_882222, partial [Ganoderma leucocontextum]
ALKIHDILCHVFEVDSNVGNRGIFSRNDLLRCALVSRAFCEPALRTLWRDMSSPTPLWRLLSATGSMPKPTSYEFEFFDSVYPQILSEKTYTDPARWARFMWYARFVQELGITNFCREYKHKKLIHALIEHNGGETIFPSLRALWWPPSSYSDSSYFVFFTPRLRTAIIDFHRCMPRDKQHPDEDPESHVFLARLHASSPRLDYLSVSTSLQRIGTNHSRLIARFEHLTVLHLIARISLTSFRELATMPRMENLHISHIRSDETELKPSQSPGRIDARNLVTMSAGGNCPSLTHLFTALDAPVLVSASVHAMCDDPPRREGYVDYISCIEAVATVGSPATLADLCIELDEDGGPRMLEYLADLLDPLLVFRNLTRFRLLCPTVALVADDGDFWAITGAWPKLREFRLCQAYWGPCVDPEDDDEGSEGIPIPTPEVLECFRDHCPDLRELVLPHLDFHADVPARRIPEDGSRHGLGYLSFGAEDLGDDDEDCGGEPTQLGDDKVVEWARYVLDLFPKLDAEKSLRHGNWMSTAKGWMEVFKRVHDLSRKP